MSKAEDMTADALKYLDAHVADFTRELSELSRIPSVSANGFPKEEVRRSAEATAEAFRRARVDNVRVLEIPGVHPYVYGEWLKRPGAPTILLYGHHDVQPPGRPEKWLSPPFEPTERGGRLYGRGTADDKGGVMVHVAAIAAYLEAAGSLPCNVKFIVEGEEEIGSENLGRFLTEYRDQMSADFIVLTDTANFATGIPALTYQLRGICQVDVEVACLKQPLHSGGWGGPVPDPVQILCRLIAGLTRDDGSLDVPGLYKNIARPSAKQLGRIRALPFNEARYRKEAGMLPGVRLGGEKRFSVYERLWTRPALTVIALEARPFLGSSNQIIGPGAAVAAHRARDGPARGGETSREETQRASAARRARERARDGRDPLVDDGPRGAGLRCRAARAQGRLRSGGGHDGLRRDHRLRRPLRPGARWRPVSPHGRHRSGDQRALGEREPASRRLGQVHARGRPPLRRARPRSGRAPAPRLG